MQFFDLNIPYLESDKSVSDISSKKQIRLKQIVKLMELGYSGIAYNRTIKGVMSESDRCTISPFPLSSLLNVSPSLSASVAFHRRLLGVPEKCAFRQYSRLTMVVDTTVQSSALNAGNPVLKTYDLIAVRPLKQNCFDIACQSSQVDLISIDLTKSLPFRLKLPMVKAAIARGVYFEIVYSSLMQDIQMRKQTIMNAKLLVEWTRGKNLIISSAAPSVLELRGPNDVVNLFSLFGLTNEFAKATISKNCRLLIANALRKKHFHKEAIRVEEMPSGALTNPKEPWIVDHVDWDPLSSGEGDLLLDEMAKAFAEIGKVSQTNKDIGFSSINGDVQSHGLQVKDFKFRTEGSLSTCGNFTGSISPSKDNVVSKITEKPQNEPTLCCSLPDKQDDAVEDSQQAVLPDFPINSTNAGGFPLSTCGNFTGSISPSKDSVVSKNTEKPLNEHTLCCSLPDKQDDAVEDSQQAVLPDFPINSTHAGGFSINSSISSQELKKFYAFETSTSPVRLSELELQRHAGIHEDKVLLSNKKNELTSKDDGFVVGCIAGSRQQVFTNCESPNCGVSQSENLKVASGEWHKTDAGTATEMHLCDQSVLSPSADITSDVTRVSLPDIIKDPVADNMTNVHAANVMNLNSLIERSRSDSLLIGDQHLLEEVDRKMEDHTEGNINTEELIDVDAMQVNPLQQAKDGDDLLLAKSMLSDDTMSECRKPVHATGESAYQSLCESRLDYNKVKRRHAGHVRFPFKRLLQVQFKKSGRTSMYKSKERSVS